MAAPVPSRIGIDTGGTFTDVVREGPGGRVVAKVPSTPARPAGGFLAALDAVGGAPRGARIRHGTTVGTNAVLTRSGARVVLVTTAGFEDLPWIGRGQRDDLHALEATRTPPLLEPGASLGLAERRDAQGAVLRAPSRAALAALRRAVAARRPEAIAVCLLHAVQDDAHEVAVREALAGLGVPVHTSASTCAEPREAERLTTVLLDAYVAPALRAYLREVLAGLPPGLRERLTVMRSDGGRMAPAEVDAAPVRTLLSGPAAGVAAAQALARRLRVPRALSFDVGGTSTDVAWIGADDAPVRSALRVGAFEACVPAIGLETVGAGGGSEIWLDTGGALRVGPQSGGADPGPACYGRGGPFALTDAWLLRGHIPESLLGGAFPLDVGAARAAGERLARRAGCSLAALCRGSVQVAAATTARALRLASVVQGKDPRSAALVAFGGAGPVLAAQTASLLGILTIHVPADPGTFAAEGTLRAPLRADAAQVVTAAAERDLPRIERALARQVRAALKAQGARSPALRAEIDARYAGQAFEVTLPAGERWRTDFHGRHATLYGFALPQAPVEAVRLRVRGAGVEAGWDADRASAGPVLPRRWTTLPVRRARRGLPAMERAALKPGRRVAGPVRLDEDSGTTVVPAGWHAGTLRDGTLRLERRP